MGTEQGEVYGSLDSNVKALANMQGQFHEGGQRAVFEALKAQGEPTGHDGAGDAPSLSTWLRLLTSLPDQDIVEYASILQAQGGAGDMHSASQLLRRPGGEERGQVLRDSGIKDGHVDVLLACVDKYDEYVAWTPEDAPGSDAPATFFSAAAPVQATKAGPGHNHPPPDAGLADHQPSQEGGSDKSSSSPSATGKSEPQEAGGSKTSSPSQSSVVSEAVAGEGGAMGEGPRGNIGSEMEMEVKGEGKEEGEGEEGRRRLRGRGQEGGGNEGRTLRQRTSDAGSSGGGGAKGGGGGTEGEKEGKKAGKPRAKISSLTPKARSQMSEAVGVLAKEVKGRGASAEKVEGALGVLCGYEDAILLRGLANAADLGGPLLSALRQFAGNEPIIVRVLSLLGVLGQDRSAAAALVKLKVDDALAESLGQHMGCVPVLEEGCMAAWVLASEKPSEMGPSLCRAVREAVKAHPGLKNGLAAFALLAKAGEPRDELFGVLAEEGGCRAIVQAVEACVADAEAVSHGLRGMWDLSSGEGETEKRNRKWLGECGAIDTIVRALGRHGGSADVWQQGVGALWALSSEDSANKRRMDQGGVLSKVIARGLVRFIQPIENGLREALLGLVINLAAEGLNMRREMGSKGVCALVLKAFRVTPDNVRDRLQLLGVGLSAMAALCTDCVDNAKRLGVGGCVELRRVLDDEGLMTFSGVSDKLDLEGFYSLHEDTCLALVALLSVADHRRLLVCPKTALAIARLLETRYTIEDTAFVEAVLLALRAMTRPCPILQANQQARPHVQAAQAREIAEDHAVLATLLSTPLTDVRCAAALPGTLLRLCRQYVGHGELLSLAVEVLCNLAQGKDAPRRFTQEQLVSMARLLESYRDDGPLRLQLLDVFNHILKGGGEKGGYGSRAAVQANLTLPLAKCNLEMGLGDRDGPRLQIGLEYLSDALLSLEAAQGVGGESGSRRRRAEVEGLAEDRGGVGGSEDVGEMIVGLVPLVMRAAEACFPASEGGERETGGKAGTEEAVWGREARQAWLHALVQLSKRAMGEGEGRSELRQALLDHGACERLVQGLGQRLEAWGEEEEEETGNSVVGSLLTALSNLAQYVEDRRLSEALGQAGVATAVAQALILGLERGHATVLGAACCAVMSLSLRCPANVTRLLASGVQGMVVQALAASVAGAAGGEGGDTKVDEAAFLQNVSVASFACAALSSLLDHCDDPAVVRRLQGEVGTKGGCESLAALLTFEGVHENGHALLMVLAACVSLLRDHQENRDRMVGLTDVVKRVVDRCVLGSPTGDGLDTLSWAREALMEMSRGRPQEGKAGKHEREEEGEEEEREGKRARQGEGEEQAVDVDMDDTSGVENASSVEMTTSLENARSTDDATSMEISEKRDTGVEETKMSEAGGGH